MIILDTVKKLRSFGRINGKGLSNTNKDIIENILPKYLVENKENTNLNEVFKNNTQNHLEIGFGYGESLAHKAELYNNINFVGCEVYTQGVSSLVKEIESKKLNNVKIFHGDSRIFLENLVDNSLATIYILFPDP